LSILDSFLFTIINELDYNKLSLIICSDHGNFEDLSVKTHTLNPALTITAGRNAEKLYKEIKNITQIKDAVIKYS
jgi:bisphosphoglycerate-independent phosphoglycerate mutase (AlkP superfamily)